VNLVEAIRRTIDRHGLLPEGIPLVVAVSGGADSVALAHAFASLDIDFTVAHLNHNLRGAESDADEAFVRSLGFPTTAKSVDVKALAAVEGLSIEMAARKARHDFFGEFDGAVIALAHHADDQVETFLLRLARGAGSAGLGGMAYEQRIGTLRLIRPMLDLRRNDILAWLRTNGFDWRVDASNADESYLRNRVRHTILPLLERELNPGLRENILRTMDILREENAWMDETLSECPMPIAGLPVAANRRILRRWLFEHGVEEAGFDAIGKIITLVTAGQGTTVFELNDRQRVVIEYGRLRFEEAFAESEAPSWALVRETGTGWRKDHGRGVGILPAEASFDAAKVDGSPITVRGWRPGDRIEPLGMEGSRKLQDILVDQKIPLARRAQVPVVECRGEVIWLPGYRTARNWAVPSAAAPSIHVRVEQI